MGLLKKERGPRDLGMFIAAEKAVWVRRFGFAAMKSLLVSFYFWLRIVMAALQDALPTLVNCICTFKF
jgi:hypothetical protein